MEFLLQKTPLYAESWNVAFRKKPEGAILTDQEAPFFVIPNPTRYWAADPMIFTHGGKTYIFAELYDYVLYRGVIGVCEYQDGGFSPWKPIIQENFHMSYPYVFCCGEEIFMIPETTQCKALLLYRAVDFPLRWELHSVIREDVSWADTSIIPVEDGFRGRTQSYGDGIQNLEIRLDKELRLVSTVPVPDSDPDTSRPGGRPFFREGKLWQIFQDCREGYGKALFFRSEGRELHLKPQDLTFSRDIFLDGMHTYSATEEFEVIDIKTRRLNLLNLAMRLKKKLHR